MIVVSSPFRLKSVLLKISDQLLFFHQALPRSRAEAFNVSLRLSTWAEFRCPTWPGLQLPNGPTISSFGLEQLPGESHLAWSRSECNADNQELGLQLKHPGR